MTARRPENRARQGGFTLIEALIAFVILSFGLLGIVSLQSLAKTSQHLAVQHTRAVTIGDAIVERIRSNPAGMPSYVRALDDAIGGGSYTGEPDPNCRDLVCDPAELADHDLWAWEQALDGAAAKIGTANAAGLIEPRGCILFTASATKTNTGRLTVIIQWRGLQETFDAVQGTEAVCGDDAEDAGDDNYRRQVVINTFVVDEAEF